MFKRQALCIGINKYLNAPHFELDYACADAAAVAQLLKDPARGAFDKVYELLDHQATKAAILSHIQTLLENAGSDTDNLVVIFFAGHSALDLAQHLYLVPYDVQFRSAAAVPEPDISTTLNLTEFQCLLTNIPVPNLLLLFDSCHAEASGKLLGHLPFNDIQTTVFVGSARSSQVAAETAAVRHGRFTYDFLNSANLQPSSGEWITLRQVLAFIDAQMKEDGLQQTVEVSGHEIGQNLCLFKNPLLSLASSSFTDQVKYFCGLSPCRLLSLQPGDDYPHLFIMRESANFGSEVNTLVFCADNGSAAITSQIVEQFASVFTRFQHKRQVHKGLLVIRKEIPQPLKDILAPSLTVLSLVEMQRMLMNFDAHVADVIKQFTERDATKPSDPAPRECYIELDSTPATTKAGLPFAAPYRRTPITRASTSLAAHQGRIAPRYSRRLRHRQDNSV